MSTPSLMDRLTPNLHEGQIAKLLPFVALFLRLSIGFSLLNAGLMSVYSKGNPGGWPMPTPGGPSPPMPGMEIMQTVVPYCELALGVGLIFGIFTTITVLGACLLTLVQPMLTALALVSSAGMMPGGMARMNRFGFEFPFVSMLFSNQSTLPYILLLLLSPLPINKFSVDALIFQRNAGPLPQSGVDADAQTEINAAD